MSDVIISPNMKLPVPVVGQEIGPDWATDINACMSGIDSHNHSSGQGVQINPSGIDINADLPFNGNSANTVKSIVFNAQSAPLSGSVVGAIYVSGKDLYYNDEDGNQVRITQSGSVTGSTGTITGLPSGTASASFSGSTFSFQSATNTPATMSIGPIVTGAAIANPKTVTISAQSSQAANYAMTWPSALPGATSLWNIDASGNQAFIAPDNSTFGLSGGTYKVLDSGIGTAQLANGAVTPSKQSGLNFTTATTGISASLTSTTFTTISGLSASIVGVGRPIMFQFTTEIGTGHIGFYSILFDGVAVAFRILRNGVDVIGQTENTQGDNNGKPITPAWFMIDESPAPGTNTYVLQASVSAGNRIDFQYCGLYIQEL